MNFIQQIYLLSNSSSSSTATPPPFLFNAFFGDEQISLSHLQEIILGGKETATKGETKNQKEEEKENVQKPKFSTAQSILFSELERLHRRENVLSLNLEYAVRRASRNANLALLKIQKNKKASKQQQQPQANNENEPKNNSNANPIIPVSWYLVSSSSILPVFAAADVSSSQENSKGFIRRFKDLQKFPSHVDCVLSPMGTYTQVGEAKSKEQQSSSSLFGILESRKDMQFVHALVREPEKQLIRMGTFLLEKV
jgi:hypothetical protein